MSDSAAYVRELRRKAMYLRADAHRLDELADKIENPPAGVRVEFGPNGVVRFVGPIVVGEVKASA